jgi:hypothetical protein
MQPTYKIHPAIGIARLGNSPELYLAPETTGGLPIQCNQKNGTVDGPEQPVSEFKDGNQLIKRQGARFRVFVYDDVSPEGRELQIGDTITVRNQNPGQISGQLFTGTLSDIQWTVYLANKKASWYEFKETAGEHGYSPKHKLRNAKIKDADLRQKLIIDPGPQTVGVTGKAGSPNSAEFALGANPTNPQTFPPPLTPNSITTLGEIMAYPQGNFARLVVLGGYGNSGSVKSGPGQPVIRDFANNDGWFDDISDGPVTAQLMVNVSAIDGRPVPAAVPLSPTFAVDENSWVIVGYPRYAPEIVDIVTLDDVVYDLSVRSFAFNTYMYGVPPFRCEAVPPSDLASWRTQAQWNPDYHPYFWRDIWPILSRPYYYQFLMDLDSLTGGDPHEIARNSGGNMDPTQISIPPFDSKDPEDRRKQAQRRQFVYRMLRQPGGENSLRIPGTLLNPNGRNGWRPYAMPYLCGDNPLKNTAASKFLCLTDTQLFILHQWAEGKFINELSEGIQPPPQGPGVELDRGSLGNGLGGAFCPGGECCWIIRNPAIYSSAYRINQVPPTPGGLSQPAVALSPSAIVNGSTPANLAAGLEPGDMTKYDAVPWQADFNECSTQPIDITYEDWNEIYPASTGDPVTSVQQLTYWWPAHRPMTVPTFNGTFNGDPQVAQTALLPWSPTPQNHQGDLQMVTAWASLGFVLRNPGVVPGSQNSMFVNVPDGNANSLRPPSPPSPSPSPSSPSPPAPSSSTSYSTPDSPPKST